MEELLEKWDSDVNTEEEEIIIDGCERSESIYPLTRISNICIDMVIIFALFTAAVRLY